MKHRFIEFLSSAANPCASSVAFLVIHIYFVRSLTHIILQFEITKPFSKNLLILAYF
uniref:Uncharacterized protein n=1 Tax=Siphoviridae sp. ctKwY15 TaxID=2827843 RepID=A0A8S5SVD5_9CAUD|nr:MAG TPA: hypothetical protein [Siphoviridae sp. ctKwY15]